MGDLSSKRIESKVTISDPAIAPFEIDVTRRDYTVVKCHVATKKDTKEEYIARTVVAYRSNLAGAMEVIIRERARDFSPDLSGKVVDLKTYMTELRTYVRKITAFFDYFRQLGQIDESQYKIKSEDLWKILKSGNGY